MANAGGFLKESIWRDREFRALPRAAQATYAQLISQKELDRAGIQPLQILKWAKGCDSFTYDDLMFDLKVLEQHRFVFIDEDTDELFIRSYMRQCEVVRYPNILKNALRCAGMVASEKLRHELAKELRRLRRAEADRVADVIEPEDYTPEPMNGSETKQNPSGTVPEPLNGSETLTEPPGMGTGTGSVTLGKSQVGEALGKSHTDETAQNQPSNEPPPERCPKHINDPGPPACGNCRAARLRRQRWDADRLVEAEALRRRIRADRDACQLCDENGMREAIHGLTRCDHTSETA